MDTIIRNRKAKRISKANGFMKNMFDFFPKIFTKHQATSSVSKKGLTEDYIPKNLEYIAGLGFPLINPDKLLDDKSKTLGLYDTMMLDDRIKSIIELKKRMTLSVNGYVVPASKEDKDEDLADWVSGNLYGMTTRWWDVLDNLLDSMVYGFKVGEKMFAMEDGKIVLKNIKFAHSILFDFGYDDYGNLDELHVGRNYGGDGIIKGIDEIKNKFVIFVYPYLKDGNVYGDSDLREVFTQYYAKYNIFRFRNIYLQNYGMPLIEVVYDHVKTTDAEIDTMAAFLRKLQDNKFLFNPGTREKNTKTGDYPENILGKFQIKLIEVKHARGTDQYESAIDQLDRQISRRLLVPDKMGFTQDTSGSRNQSAVFFDILKMVIKDLHGRLEDIINNLIIQLVDLNYPGIEEYPRWEFEKIDKTIATELLKLLIEKGVIDKRERWIRSYVGVPELTEEEQDALDEEEEVEPQPEEELPPAEPQEELPEEEVNKNRVKCNRNKLILYKNATAKLVKQISKRKIIENKDTSAVKRLRIDKTDLKLWYVNHYKNVYGEESPKQIEDRAYSAVGVIENRILKSIEDTLVSGFKNRVPNKIIENKIVATLKEDGEVFKS